MEPNCVSYNMLVSSDSSTITTCELNNSTHFEHPDDLLQFPNSTYRGTKVRVYYKAHLHVERQLSWLGHQFCGPNEGPIQLAIWTPDHGQRPRGRIKYTTQGILQNYYTHTLQ